MTKRLPILCVVQVNNPHAERYVIEDQKQRVWSGNRFSSHNPTLYAKHNDAAVEVQSILKRNFEGVEPQRFVVPLYVEVLNSARLRHFGAAAVLKMLLAKRNLG